MHQTNPLQRKLQSRGQNLKTVLHAAAEVNGRGLFEILGGTGNLPNAEAEVHALRQHLIVKHEVVGIFKQRQLGEHFSAEGAVASVVLGQLHSQKQILERSEKTIGNVFVNGHAAEQSAAADDARSQHDVIDIVGDHAGHRHDQQRRVLVVGMEHDDNVRAGGQSLTVAGLLVTSVAIVAVMLEHVQTQAARQIDSVVGTVIVHQDAHVDKIGQFSHGGLESLLRVVSGHGNRDALGVNHFVGRKLQE